MTALLYFNKKDLPAIKAIAERGPVELAKEEVEALDPIIKAWVRRLSKYGHDFSPERIKEIIIKTAEATKSSITSLRTVFTSAALYGQSQNILQAITDLNQTKFGTGIRRFDLKNNQQVMFPVISLDKTIIEKVPRDDLEQILSPLSKIFYFKNHDILHHLTATFVPELHVEYNNYDFSDNEKCYEHYHFAQRGASSFARFIASKGKDYNYTYEEWANASYKYTWNELTQDPEFVNEFKSYIEKYFNALDKCYESLREQDPEFADFVYNYFFDITFYLVSNQETELEDISDFVLERAQNRRKQIIKYANEQRASAFKRKLLPIFCIRAVDPKNEEGWKKAIFEIKNKIYSKYYHVIDFGPYTEERVCLADKIFLDTASHLTALHNIEKREAALEAAP